jgi:hypothetical protein
MEKDGGSRLSEGEIRTLARLLAAGEEEERCVSVDLDDRGRLPTDADVEAVNGLVGKVMSGEVGTDDFDDARWG